MHIGDALGEQCTRLLQGMLAVSAHKDMPPGFLLLPFLEPAAGTGTFAALKGRLRKAKGKLLSKVFRRWAVVFFCQHDGCKDPLGAHPPATFELREATETLRKLAPYLQALSTLVKVGAAVGRVLQLPLPSRIPFVSDAVGTATEAAGLMRSELGELYESVGEELALEAGAAGDAAAAGGAAAAAVAAAGQAEQDSAYQAVKAALDNKRAAKKSADWRQQQGLQLCAVMQQQLWCCRTCAAQLGGGGGGGGGGSGGSGGNGGSAGVSFALQAASSTPRGSTAGAHARKFTAHGSCVLWSSGSVLRFLAGGGKWKRRYCEVTESGLNVAMDAASLDEAACIDLDGAEIDEAPTTNATKKGASLDKEHMVGVQTEQALVLLCTRDAEDKAGLLAALRQVASPADGSSSGDDGFDGD
jgi:nucleoid-associated protein YgaU